MNLSMSFELAFRLLLLHLVMVHCFNGLSVISSCCVYYCQLFHLRISKSVLHAYLQIINKQRELDS